MAIAYFTQFPQGDTDTANQIAARINEQLAGKPPAGGIYHAEGPTDDGGWWTFNVWASADDFETFRRQILQPALDEVNLAPADRRQLQVHWDSSQMSGGS